MPETEICTNCYRSIGALEKVHLWQEKIVCKECYDRLYQPPTDAEQGELLAAEVLELDSTDIDKETQEKISSPERSIDEPPTDDVLIWGFILTISGIVVTSYAALLMDVGIGDVANLDRMNQRLGLIVIGTGLFVSGIVALSVNAICRMVWRIQRFPKAEPSVQAPERP